MAFILKQDMSWDGYSDDDFADLLFKNTIYDNWGQGSNHAGISNEVVPNQSNVSTPESSQPHNFSDAPFFKRSCSANERKRKIDRDYRLRCKKANEDMKSNLEHLTAENKSLKKENDSLKKDNASINQTLIDQEKEIDRLRTDLCHLKSEYERQNVLLQTLSEHLADPVRVEYEKLKDENALLKNANINSNFSSLVEENAKLKIENKVLKVQNDALCGKIISDNDKKREEK